MSDLQDLIHKTSMDCLAKGKQQEQERIIKLLDALKETRPTETNTNYWGYSFERIIALIKGDN